MLFCTVLSGISDNMSHKQMIFACGIFTTRSWAFQVCFMACLHFQAMFYLYQELHCYRALFCFLSRCLLPARLPLIETQGRIHGWSQPFAADMSQQHLSQQ
jgi:hypothetical protein